MVTDAAHMQAIFDRWEESGRADGDKTWLIWYIARLEKRCVDREAVAGYLQAELDQLRRGKGHDNNLG